jgi:ADP-heptose:LPS heptosyltransferase
VSDKIKILVIRFSSIGDIVLTTPVLRLLKKKFGNKIEIHYLTKKTYDSVLKANPYVTKIHSFDKNLSSLKNTLKNEHFDHIIDLHKNVRSQTVINWLKVPALRFNKLNWEKWLLVNFKIDKLPDIHIVDRYVETLSSFDIYNDNEGLDYFIPEEDKIDVTEELNLIPNQYVAFVIGAAHETKKFPKEKITYICNMLNAKTSVLSNTINFKNPLKIVLIGGKEDNEDALYIYNHTQNTINACGKYNINQSASIIEQAKAVITNDTGMMHIAAAFNKPIVSIWGNTVPKFGMYPYEPKHPENVVIVENENLNCRPCSKIGFSKCPRKHFKCMQWENERLIIDNTLEFLKK